MLNLTQIENVTEEERCSELYNWAKLFKATTWEEIKMLADKDASISEFTFTLHEMTEDEKIYQQCLARERYERDQTSMFAYGVEQGMEKINKLHSLLVKAKRFEDLERSTTDLLYQKELLKEFGLDQNN